MDLLVSYARGHGGPARRGRARARGLIDVKTLGLRGAKRIHVQHPRSRRLMSTQLLQPALHAALATQLGGQPEDFALPLYAVDPLGRVMFCNRALAELVGERAEDLLGKPSLLLYPSEATPALLMQRVHALIGSAAPRKLSTRLRCKGGTVPVELSATPLEHEGAVACLVVQVRPVAAGKERPAVEYLLRLSPQEADALPYGLIMLDRSGTVIAYNANEARLSGLEPQRVLGRNFFADIAPCTAVREFAGLYRQMIEAGAPASAQFEFLFRFRHGDRAVSIQMAWFPQIEQGLVLVDPKPRQP